MTKDDIKRNNFNSIERKKIFNLANKIAINIAKAMDVYEEYKKCTDYSYQDRLCEGASYEFVNKKGFVSIICVEFGYYYDDDYKIVWDEQSPTILLI